MSIIAFRIALTLDVNIVWFGCQVAVCVQKRHKNTIFGCSWFQKFNFDCLLLKLLIFLTKTENIYKFVCPLWTQSSIMISGTQIYSTLFLALSHKSWQMTESIKDTQISVFGAKIKSLSSKQSKLNFWNRLHPKKCILCRLLTQTATQRQNYTIFTSSVKAILKAMTDTVFLGPSLGVVGLKKI